MQENIPITLKQEKISDIRCKTWDDKKVTNCYRNIQLPTIKDTIMLKVKCMRNDSH